VAATSDSEVLEAEPGIPAHEQHDNSAQPLESEISFRLLFENNPSPMWIYDAATFEFLNVNKEAVSLLGFDRDQIMRMTIREICATRSSLSSSAARTQSGSKPNHLTPKVSQWLVRKDGRTIEAELTRHRIFFMARNAVLVLVRDQTELRRTRRNAEFQAQLLELANDAVVVVDLGLHITKWNKKAESLYGWNSGEAIGKLYGELLQTGDLESARGTTVKTGQWNGELSEVTKTKRGLIVRSYWTLIRDESEEPLGMLMVNCDITEKRTLEAQFLRAQRLESIGTLASGIAHDLNNILSPILMSAGLLRRTIPDPENQKLLTAIESSAERGADIVKQVLTFARGVEGERILLQPRHLVGELVKIMSQTFPKNITIRAQFPKDLWMVAGDATQLHQVLLNLCVNARDAMPNGGTLMLGAENVIIGEEFVEKNAGAQLGAHVSLKVSDTGTGIPAEVAEKIFDPFFTTKEAGKGTGLGLSTVLAIVRSHGGVVNLETAPNEGTTFRVLIPATIDAVDGEAKSEPQPSRLGNGEVILLVDDESSVRIAAVKTLEYSGYQVYTAEDGTDALALYFQRRSQIQLVLTDIEMELMDGVELVKRLKQFDPAVKVIVSSGQCHDAERSVLETLGVTRFLDKPYSSEQLLGSVYEELHATNVTNS
jgi:two-component system cell cycle sensor histidine kinase/response regulator CckA